MNHLFKKLRSCITVGLLACTSTHAADGRGGLNDISFDTPDLILNHLKEELADGIAAKKELAQLKGRYANLTAKIAAIKWQKIVLEKKNAEKATVQDQTKWQRFTHWLGSLDYNKIIPVVLLGIAKVVGIVLTFVL